MNPVSSSCSKGGLSPLEAPALGWPLVTGRRVTGLSWTQEVLAGVAKRMPYNAEAEMKRRGVLYGKAFLPFVSHAVADDRLVTGRNPWSAKATAGKVAALL
jgi:putative intracellular protease/amidase